MIKYSGREFEARYTLGQIVYHRATTDRIKGVITSLKLYADGGMAYEVNWGDKSSDTHFEMELSDTFLQEYSE